MTCCKAVNVLQAAASEGKQVDEDAVYEVVSKAKPQDVHNLITKALSGDFMGARNLLRETMVLPKEQAEKTWLVKSTRMFPKEYLKEKWKQTFILI